MQHQEGTFKNDRGQKIYYEGWLPDGKAKAVLFLVHGLGEYVGRYTNLVNHFVPLGYAIYGVDHLGHGKSEGEREMLHRFEDYITPLETFYKMVTGWQPGIPVFIYGHSMGGLIAAYYLLDHQADFKGAILSAAAVKVPENVTAFTVTMGKLLSAIAPKAGVLGLDTANLSHDQAVVDAYNSDPLVFHGKTPARLSAEMLRAMTRVSAEINHVTLPVFILNGSGDRLVDPSAGQMLFDKIGSTDKTRKLYDGLYHEVHNEPQRELLFADLSSWLDKHL